MKSEIKQILCGLVMAGAAAFLLPSAAQAVDTGLACSNCHTMHASQDGGDMSVGGKTVTYGSPGDALTIGCIGCHTGTNSVSPDPTGGKTPYVLDTSEPNYGAGLGLGDGTGANSTTLAGGNFWWVEEGTTAVYDSKGHNVQGMSNSSEDSGMSDAPGGTMDMDTLTCAGATTGCHSTGGHHGNSLDGTPDGTSVAESFRFLKGVYGDEVLGYEDLDYEYQTTGGTDHNQYYGDGRTDDSTADTAGTISGYCGACHGMFHSGAGDLGISSTSTWGGAGASPWIRHPVDFDINGVDHKPDYSGMSANYSVVSPTGSEVVTSPLGTIFAADGDAIVTCISCHRAHGTPFDDLLRWDYSAVVTGSGATGTACFVCHTTK